MASVAKRKWTHKGNEREAWVVRYVDKGGKHRSRQFDRKKEAADWKRQVENEMEAGTHVARRDSRTVADLIDEFTEDVHRRMQDGRCGRGYVDRCITSAHYIRAALGNVLVRDLRWQEVERFAVDLRTTASRKTGRPMAKRSISNIIALFGTMVAYAVRRGYAAKSAVSEARREIGPQAPDRIETFSRDEIRTIIATLEVRAFRRERRQHALIKAMVYLAAMCGLRKGEICALRRESLDFKVGTVTIDAALDGYDVMKGPKTKAGIRTVPMPGPVAHALQEFLPYVVPEPRGLLFRTALGGKINDAGIYKTWHAILIRAGMPGDKNGRYRHFHALRHFAGSAWLEGGIPLPEVSRLLGHAHTGVTAEIYSHAVLGTHHRATELERAASLVLPAQPLAIAQELRNVA